ncbi:MAG: methyltransferase domain-containing protein [Candidatus Peribacter sp.]|nr:methyltransferase domain-containing protein [Candidatus Peribacter sp.]
MNSTLPPWSTACPLCSHAPRERMLRDLAAFECPSCGFLWLRDRSTAPEYEESVVDLSAEKIRTRKRNCYNRVAMIAKHISLDRVCDIGCGEGLFLAAVRDQHYSDPMGLEPSSACVSYGRSIGLSIEQGMVEDYPALFSGRPRDVVTLFHVIEHLVDPFETMRMFRSVLHPGSFLVIETPNIESYSARKWGDRWRMIYRQHLSYFNPSTLRSCLEQAGFDILAEGTQDFDQNFLSWGELKLRLGLKKVPPPSREPSSQASTPSSQKATGVSRGNILKDGVRYFLSRLVGLLGRRDYIWVIARVP